MRDCNRQHWGKWQITQLGICSNSIKRASMVMENQCFCFCLWWSVVSGDDGPLHLSASLMGPGVAKQSYAWSASASTLRAYVDGFWWLWGRFVSSLPPVAQPLSSVFFEVGHAPPASVVPGFTVSCQLLQVCRWDVAFAECISNGILIPLEMPTDATARCPSASFP